MHSPHPLLRTLGTAPTPVLVHMPLLPVRLVASRSLAAHAEAYGSHPVSLRCPQSPPNIGDLAPFRLTSSATMSATAPHHQALALIPMTMTTTLMRKPLLTRTHATIRPALTAQMPLLATP